MKNNVWCIGSIALAAGVGTLVGSVIPTEREIIVNRTSVKTVEIAKPAKTEDFVSAFNECMGWVRTGSEEQRFRQIPVCQAFAREAIKAGT